MSDSILQNTDGMSVVTSNLDNISSDIGGEAVVLNDASENLKGAWVGTGCEHSSNACKTLFSSIVQVSKIVGVMSADTNQASSIMSEVDERLSSGFKG